MNCDINLLKSLQSEQGFPADPIHKSDRSWLKRTEKLGDSRAETNTEQTLDKAKRDSSLSTFFSETTSKHTGKAERKGAPTQRVSNLPEIFLGVEQRKGAGEWAKVDKEGERQLGAREQRGNTAFTEIEISRTVLRWISRLSRLASSCYNVSLDVPSATTLSSLSTPSAAPLTLRSTTTTWHQSKFPTPPSTSLPSFVPSSATFSGIRDFHSSGLLAK